MNPQFENNPARKGRSNASPDYNSRISMPSIILVKAKLEMTEPGDADEREADEMADSIINEGKIAKSVIKGHSGSGVALPSRLGDQLASLQGNGSRLYGDLKTRMESGFGRDFSDVRLHTDGTAAEMSDSISAKAFTYGNDIYFNRGQFNPATIAGQHLIAHELTHVAQGLGKVGREDNVPKSGHDLYNEYIKDPDYSLYYSNTTVMEENYRSRDVRQPLTIVLFTAKEADEKRAFFKDDPINDFIFTEKRTKVLMIQGLDSLSNYCFAIENLVSLYGPLQNLIIMGHGWHDSVELGPNVRIDTSPNSEGFYKMIYNLFEKADIECRRKIPHSILLPVCLTGAVTDSPNGLVNHIQTKMDTNVLVMGNKAAVSDGQEYRYEQREDVSDWEYLYFTDKLDPTSPIIGQNYTPIQEPKDKEYYGDDAYGTLYKIAYHLEKQLYNEDSRSDRPFSFDYLDSSDLSSKFKVNCIYNSTLMKKEFSLGDVLPIIRRKIRRDPMGVYRFICVLLFNTIQVDSPNPSARSLFRIAQRASSDVMKNWRLYPVNSTTALSDLQSQ